MPCYTYRTEDGRVVERFYKYSERPAHIYLEDGTRATYNISPVSRLSSWSDCANYGVSGKYNKTLGTYITSTKQHDDLCKEKGIQKMGADSVHRLDTHMSTRDKQHSESVADRKKYADALTEHKDPLLAYQAAYGAEEREIMKKADDSIFEKYPQAKAIPKAVLDKIN